MKRVISDISEQNIRLLSILEYLKIASNGLNIEGVESKIDPKLIEDIYRVNPESTIWANEGYYYQAFFGELLLGNLENPSYLFKILQSNQSEEVKAGILYLLVQFCSYKKLDSLQDKYYNMLISQFPESDRAFRAKASFSKDKSIQVGKTIPNFELKNLDNESEVINPQILKGKYVLVDIWGTWCAPCLKELPYLVEAYSKFKDKNFTIYSVAIETDAETVRKFRIKSKKILWLSEKEQPQTTMPWLHSYAGDWNSQIVKTFEVVGVPSTFLIDPEGKIIATSRLRGDELLNTLEKLIK
jgi:thiol-disulfide isomerase/thioredoxin